MSTSDSRTYRIDLTGEPGSELFVVDSSFQLRARGVDRLSVTLPGGVYKLKIRRGREEREEHVLLERDLVRRLETPALASPAPLDGTSRTHEYHVAAASSLSREIHVTAGAGAQVFLMARYWTSQGRAVEPRAHPARGLSLHTFDGRQVVDYQTSSVAQLNERDPFAACTVEVDPGPYILRRDDGAGTTLEQVVIASPGWQTELFVLKDPVLAEPLPEDAGEAAEQQRIRRPDATSLLMSRNGFDAGQSDLELVEVARLALADERRVLSEQLASILEGKFENPFLGILGAHLLVLAHDRAGTSPDPRHKDVQPDVPTGIDQLGAIIENLRNLVGRDHPDVEALSLRVADRRLRTNRPFTVPPMLKRSWSLLVKASNSRRSLVPAELYDRVRSFVIGPAYFVWAVSATNAPDPARRLASAETKFRAAEATRETRGTSTRGDRRGSAAPPRASLRGGVGRGAYASLGPMADALGPSSDSSPRRRPSRPRPQGPTNKELASMSIESDIPRGAIDRAFGRD